VVGEESVDVYREVNERFQCSNSRLTLGQVGFFLEAVRLGFLNWAGSMSNGFCEGESLCGGPSGVLSGCLNARTHKLYSCAYSHTRVCTQRRVRHVICSGKNIQAQMLTHKLTHRHRGSLSSGIVGDVWDSDPAQCLSIASIHLV